MIARWEETGVPKQYARREQVEYEEGEYLMAMKLLTLKIGNRRGTIILAENIDELYEKLENNKG